MSNVVWGFPAPSQTVLGDSTAQEPYKVYAGLFTQAAANDNPIVQEAINTFGFACNWVRVGTGIYNLQLTSPVSISKLFIGGFGTFIGNGNTYLPISSGSAIIGYWSIFPNYSLTPDNIAFAVVDNTFNSVDLYDLIGSGFSPNVSGLYFEIKIYN